MAVDDRFPYSPLVLLTYKAGTSSAAGSGADPNFLYVVANELIYKWRMVFTAPNEHFVLDRPASLLPSLYDYDSNTFVAGLMWGFELNLMNTIRERLSASGQSMQVHVTFNIRYKTFFERLLRWCTRTESDGNTLAHPPDPDLERAFSVRSGRGGTALELANTDEEFRDVPASLVRFELLEADGNRGAKIGVRLDLDRLSTLDRDRVARALIAADWSKIYERAVRAPGFAWFQRSMDEDQEPGEVPPVNMVFPELSRERRLMVWERNLWRFLYNYIPIERGKQLLLGLSRESVDRFSAGADRTPAAAVGIVRDLVDRSMVTANHWAEAREDRRRETYQWKLSNALGTILANRPRASLVQMLRTLTMEDPHPAGHAVAPVPRWPRYPMPSREERLECMAALAIQSGVGHCGEHALVSYSILKKFALDLIQMAPAILSGSPNIDHAFVVVGLQPRQLIRTHINAADNPNGSVGEAIVVFDLRQALAQGGNRGWICDAYLEAGRVERATAQGLLQSMRQRRSNLRTDYVLMEDFQPHRGGSVPPTVEGGTLPNI